MTSEIQPGNLDQHQHWNTLYQDASMDSSTSRPSDFAVEVQERLVGKQKILELGCGRGNDALFFARHGNEVIAIDFSEVVTEKLQAAYGGVPGVHFEVGEISHALGFHDNEFDVVYARLSLHYFRDQVTRQIFQEIHRILKPGGLLCFMCKSRKDPLYGVGIAIETDMYEKDAHIRHFFSEDYAKICLAGNYSIDHMISMEGELYGTPAAYIKVAARKQPIT